MHSMPASHNSAGGRSVNIRIDELVLRGFAAADRGRIARAVEQELARLLSAGNLRGLRESPPSVERVYGGTFRVKAGSSAQTTGEQIAQAVHRGLRGQVRAIAQRSPRSAASGSQR
jgi:hypothetical protein